MPDQSTGLLAALHAAMNEMPALKKDATNPHYKNKYISLDGLTDAVTPILLKHGLLWSTFPCSDTNGQPALRYKLSHVASGEVEQDTMPLLLSKSDSQGQGSAITYARRYALQAVLNLVADEDDDGNKASGQRQRPQPTAEPSNGGPRLATAKQRGLLNAKAGEAALSPSQFANAILLAGGAEEPREFADEDAAKALVNRMLDRLPAQLVDPTLSAIEAATA